MVAPHALLGLFGLKGLVLTRGLETVYSVIVSLAITGPHLLDPVHGCLLSLSISPLTLQRLVFVPPLLPLPFSWHIHGPIRSNAVSTGRPTYAIAGMDFSWPLAGPAAVARSGPCFDGNRPGRCIALEPNAWLGNGCRRAGSALGFWLSVLASGLVWVGVVVWASSGRPAVHVSASKSRLCFSGTTRVYAACQVWIFVGHSEHN